VDNLESWKTGKATMDVDTQDINDLKSDTSQDKDAISGSEVVAHIINEGYRASFGQGWEGGAHAEGVAAQNAVRDARGALQILPGTEGQKFRYDPNLPNLMFVDLYFKNETKRTFFFSFFL
jgi:hypothetical protein